jgi:ankyrin repeat protein
MAPHKKHLDAHGQTFLARACAKGEYDIAKQRLQERPEDINVADYAGNTPLQIAALNGYDDIVRLLVDAGCNLDCVNNDKDTPLLDAVENGHLDVVKILLDAGVNPRKANAYGQEPIDRVNDELDNADEIRAALQEAKQKMGERRRTSEEHHPDLADARSSHGPDSPRRSPGASGSIHAGGGRRAGTVRATKTSNHLLYMPMDDKTLRAAAARGDEETVTRILQVRENFDDPESMVAAARGGHDIVMQLLLALGRANPDPPPIPSSNSEYSTPMLAAIGQENIKVVRLLLDQTDFDPTRRIKGETYYEIAKRRRGPNWMEEEHMLKDAYDEYKKTHKENSKNRSPNRREQDREPRRKVETKDDAAKSHKRKAVSPTREPKKLTGAKQPTSPKEKRRPASLATQPDEQTSPKRGPGRPKKEDRVPTIAISDREPSPAARPVAKVRRAESDLAAVSSEGETVKPRRKLVSGRELKGERERERERQQQRRPSVTSNASTMKEPSSPREDPDRIQKTEKYHDRTKALKRDESRDRLSVSGESTGKRYRSSATPPHLGPPDKDGNEAPVKRRRLDAEGKEKRPRSSQSDDRLPKATAPRDLPSNSATGPRPPPKAREEEDRKLTPKPKKADTLLHHGRRESGKSVSSEGSIHVKSEDPDVDMPDASFLPDGASASRSSLQKDKEEDEKRKSAELEARAREAKRKEEEERRREEDERRREEEEKEKERLRHEEEAKRVAEAEARKREEEQRRKEEEEERERARKEEEERRRREEEERKQREEEERRRLEEEEEKKREEAERRRRVEEQRRQKEEEERKRREEEERLRRQLLEREAAEEARKREEEERKEQERKERVLREEMERRRAAREAERAAKEADQRRIRLEQERARLAKLPPVLRWLDSAVNPKLPEVAEKFSTMQGVRYDCINPEANGTRDGREQWLLNTQVALLLGEKDLELSRCTSEPRMLTRRRTAADESIQIPPGPEFPSRLWQSALFGGWSRTDMRSPRLASLSLVSSFRITTKRPILTR